MVKGPPRTEARSIQILSVYRINEMIVNRDRLHSHCISISDPEDDGQYLNPNHGFSDVLQLKFHDIDAKKELPRDLHPKPPNRRIILRIVEFFAGNSSTATGFSIHCHAGVHRSVAAGLIGLYMMSHDSDLAKEQLVRIKPLPLPNRRMVRLFDRLYGTDLSRVTAELYERCDDFLADRIHIDQDDYLDELEPVGDG